MPPFPQPFGWLLWIVGFIVCVVLIGWAMRYLGIAL